MILIPSRVGFLQEEALFPDIDVGYSFSSFGVLLQFPVRLKKFENTINYQKKRELPRALEVDDNLLVTLCIENTGQPRQPRKPRQITR